MLTLDLCGPLYRVDAYLNSEASAKRNMMTSHPPPGFWIACRVEMHRAG